MMPMINEAVLCLQEHVASAGDIDMAAIAGIGMKMGDERVGPLAVADKIGLDLVLAKMEQFKRELGPRFHPARLLRLQVRANHLGEKTGRGFLEHVG
jgi:3-hydroxybutyryl-CoA dehydrogenase